MTSPPEAPPAQGLTQADAELIAELKQQGVFTTPAKLGRLRDEGLISAPIRRAAGRGRGRPSTHYPPGTLERVVAIIRIQKMLGRRAPYEDMPMWLFLFGYDIDLPTVRNSFNESAYKLREWQGRHKGVAKATRLGETMFKNVSRTFLGKLLSRNLGLRKIRYESPAGHAVHAVIDFVLGNQPHPEGLRTLGVALGITDQRVLDEAVEVVREIRIRDLPQRLIGISDEELIEGRNNVSRFVEIAAREGSPMLGKTWQSRAANAGAFMRIRAVSGMVAVIQMAHAERASGFITDNLTRGLDASRNGYIDDANPETKPVES